jgi:hypothetical protein
MDRRQLWESDDRPAWERDLDALVRPSLVTDPPPAVQQAILAAVLQAAAPAPVPTPVLTPLPVLTPPVPDAAGARPIPLAAYLLLAAVLVAYVAAVSWLQGLVGGTGWLPAMLNQLLTVSELVVGRPETTEPMALAWLLLQRAPWLALLPLGWLLWERDRAAASAA